MMQSIRKYHSLCFAIERSAFIFGVLAIAFQAYWVLFATFLISTPAFLVTFFHRCAVCGKHVYRFNRKMRTDVPLKESWGYVVHGPNHACPHKLSDRGRVP